jgi:hypothetical protein
MVQNKVKHYRKKIFLCGCYMPVKTKLAFASCPADKWTTERISPDELIHLKTMLIEWDRIGRLAPTDEHEFVVYLRKLTGENINIGGCYSCLVELVELAKRATFEIEI